MPSELPARMPVIQLVVFNVGRPRRSRATSPHTESLAKPKTPRVLQSVWRRDCTFLSMNTKDSPFKQLGFQTDTRCHPFPCFLSFCRFRFAHDAKLATLKSAISARNRKERADVARVFQETLDGKSQWSVRRRRCISAASP